MYQVNIAGEDKARSNVEDVLKLSVRNDKGDMVPFGSFATITPTMGSATVSRYNMYQTASLTATPAKGTSSSTAIKAMEEIVAQATGNSLGR